LESSPHTPCAEPGTRSVPATLRVPAHVLAAILVLAAPAAAADNEPPKVTEVPEPIVEKFHLDTTFYKKHLDYKGFSILGSAKVSDEALLEARYLIDRLLCDREDILRAMIKRGCRFMVMAPTEMTTDVPEQRRLKDDPKTNWDRRARGL